VAFILGFSLTYPYVIPPNPTIRGRVMVGSLRIDRRCHIGHPSSC